MIPTEQINLVTKTRVDGVKDVEIHFSLVGLRCDDAAYRECLTRDARKVVAERAQAYWGAAGSSVGEALDEFEASCFDFWEHETRDLRQWYSLYMPTTDSDRVFRIHEIGTTDFRQSTNRIGQGRPPEFDRVRVTVEVDVPKTWCPDTSAREVFICAAVETRLSGAIEVACEGPALTVGPDTPDADAFPVRSVKATFVPAFVPLTHEEEGEEALKRR